MVERTSSSAGAAKLTYGGVAGCCAKTALAPLERARIMQQTTTNGLSLGATLRSVYTREGISGFWAGNGAAMLRVFPQRGIAFATNDLLTEAVHTHGTPLGMHKHAAGFVTGGASGFVACAATYPLDLMRGRLGARSSNQTTLAAALGHAFRTRTLYAGALPTLIGSIPFDGVRFGVVAYLAKRHAAHHDGERPDSVMKAAHGAVAGLSASVTTYPNDTIRRILQQPDHGYRNYAHCALSLFRAQGLGRLYRGLAPNLIKAAPSAAIQFGTFELLKSRALFG